MTPSIPEKTTEPAAFEEIAQAVRERLAQNQRVRRTLPGQGRLRMDRQLPFLCLYRAPSDRPDLGTRELITTEAAYLFASGDSQQHAGLTHLCQEISSLMIEHFGLFLLLEVWAEDVPMEAESDHRLLPAFRIVCTDAAAFPSALGAFQKALKGVQQGGNPAQVELVSASEPNPPGLKPMLSTDANVKPGCFWMGLAVRPIYRNQAGTILYPMVLQSLRRQLAPVLRITAAAFAGLESRETERAYESLGPTSWAKAVHFVDQELRELSEAFDFLLQVTPINSRQAYHDFAASQCEQRPAFAYRPLPYHPNLMKRRLFTIPIERIEDTTAAHLFWEKQEELDRQLTALRDLDTPQFLPNSLQLYGRPDATLIQLSRTLLDHQPATAEPPREEPLLDARHVARAAREQIEYYQRQLPQFDPKIEICNHIAAGLMVAHDRFLISETVQVHPQRLLPLLHHEIGTHLLTYFNGKTQPFQQLATGLAGYEDLQEGLAVLAEFLVGGLPPRRLRILAARVLAVQTVVDGADFIETFRLLHRDYHFSQKQAFTTTLRVHRGGGLTKDLLYLRGLRDVLDYLSQGHEIEPLYVGKIALSHVPFIQELRRRGMIQTPPLLPRFYDEESHLQERLELCRTLPFLQLMEIPR